MNLSPCSGPPFLYRNTGAGSMELVERGHPVDLGGPVEVGSWADYDNDGDPDLFVSRSGPEINLLYRNEGHGSFVLVQNAPDNRKELSVGAAWADYDNDGDLDLFVPNTHGANNYLFFNQRDGTLLRVMEGQVVTDGGNSWAVAAGDYDNDGAIDLA